MLNGNSALLNTQELKQKVCRLQFLSQKAGVEFPQEILDLTQCAFPDEETSSLGCEETPSQALTPVSGCMKDSQKIHLQTSKLKEALEQRILDFKNARQAEGQLVQKREKEVAEVKSSISEILEQVQIAKSEIQDIVTSYSQMYTQTQFENLERGVNMHDGLSCQCALL